MVDKAKLGGSKVYCFLGGYYWRIGVSEAFSPQVDADRAIDATDIKIAYLDKARAREAELLSIANRQNGQANALIERRVQLSSDLMELHTEKARHDFRNKS